MIDPLQASRAGLVRVGPVARRSVSWTRKLAQSRKPGPRRILEFYACNEDWSEGNCSETGKSPETALIGERAR